MGKKTSRKGKGGYVTYQAENRVLKNKVKRLESVVAKNPKDSMAKRALERFKNGEFTLRSKPAHNGARLNPIHIEMIAKEVAIAQEKAKSKNHKLRQQGQKDLAEAKAKTPGSLQSLSGRVTSHGKAVMQVVKFSKAVSNALKFDKSFKSLSPSS